METETFEKTMLESQIEMKAVIWSAADLKRTVIRPQAAKSLIMKENEQLLSCSYRTSTSNDLITNKLQKHNPAVYLGLAFNFEKEILNYSYRTVSELVHFILKLKRS